MGQSNCKECPLNGRTEVPFTGNRNAEILFVGESPGRKEVIKGKPFVGESGLLIRENLKGTGIDFDECRVANSARCLINKNELTLPQQKAALATCRSKLIREIERGKPKIIVLLGAFALTQVLKTGGITRKRGRLVWSKEFSTWCLPMFHPAYILRNRNMELFLQQDLKYLGALKEVGFDPEKITPGDRKYREARSIKKLLDLAAAASSPLYVAYDTETQGLDYKKAENYVICFSLSWEKGSGVCCFLHEKKPDGRVVPTPQLPRLLKQLKKLHEHPNIRVIMQNAKYDMHHTHTLFRRYKKKPPTFNNLVLDTQVAAHVINEAYRQISLDELQRSLLSEYSEWKRSFDEKFDKTNMSLVPKADLIPYAVEDTDTTLQVGLTQISILRKNKKKLRYVKKITMPIEARVLYEIEKNGVYFDRAAMPAARETIMAKVKEFYKKAFDLVPKVVVAMHEEKGLAFSRRDFVCDILFSESGFAVQPPLKTKSGAPAVGAEARTKIKDLRPPSRVMNFLNYYEQWSRWNGLLSKGFKTLPLMVTPRGRLHSSYTTTVPVTGRVASSNPNLMNIPKRYEGADNILRLFSVPDDSWCLLWCDLSQIELRLMAHVADDKAMQKVYHENGDIHTATARALASKKWDALSADEQKAARTMAKPGNFGLLYGMQPPGFATYCRVNFGLKVSLGEAERYINNWFGNYNGVKRFHREQELFLKKHGYVDTMLGRRRHLPDVWAQDPGVASTAIRQGINFPIQSPASDMALYAMALLLDSGLLDRKEILLVMFIHDANVFQVKKDKLHKYAPIVKSFMENLPLKENFGVELTVPIVTDLEYGPNAADLKPVSTVV